MHRRGVCALPLMLLLRANLHANAANGDRRKEKLFSMFIAPCCWRENLLVHYSPKADELRAEIESMIRTGRTDTEIKQSLVDRYTLRILSEPEGARGQWLTGLPWAMLAGGLVSAGWFILRSAGRGRAAAGDEPAELPELPETDWN